MHAAIRRRRSLASGEWRAVQDDPLLGVVGIEIPKGPCWLGRLCPQ